MTAENKPQRRSLTGGLGAIRNNPPEAAPATGEVPSSTVPRGFDTVPVPVGEVDRLRANQAPEAPRRVRGGGRSMPFSLKLRPDTLEYIYAIANDRNIPLAQVIEELVDTHSKAFPKT
jgi:hypothetical protein